jgi:hypothetical protein
MAIRSTQPVVEISNRNLPGGKAAGWCIRLTSLPLVGQLYRKSESFHVSEPYGPPQSTVGMVLFP